jgi:tRNA nucleotidyltransferase (CCA-adding enzyme)
MRGKLPIGAVPDAVVAVVERLGADGHASWLVGGCVRDLLAGRTPVDFDVATPARPETVLAMFRRAVPTGLLHGTVMVPTAAGPVDVTTFRGGPSLDEDLAHRDFTVNAIALDPCGGEIRDPFEGRADLDKGRLRAVGSARDRFAEDPLRALRAARLAASLDLEVDPEVEAAMGGAAPGLERVARERVRHELGALLLAPGAAAGLRLLRRTGLEARLAPGAAADAPDVVAGVPARLDLRIAAWLRGARVVPILRTLRFSRRTVDAIAHLLRWHPVETGVDIASDASVRRHLKRVGEDALPDRVALRRAELLRGAEAGTDVATQALARLAGLEAAVGRVRAAGSLALHRHELAIRGDEVMHLLGTGPGPHVGRALRHLTEQVIEDPAKNHPETLRALLLEWRASGTGGGA